MLPTSLPGGTWTLGDLSVTRFGYGAMQLAGPAGPQSGSLAQPFETLVDLQQQGLIRHLGVSNATTEQITEAQAIAPIVCVQNMYNLAHRRDDKLIDMLAEQGVAYVPFFPLGGFSPLQSAALSTVAARVDATPMSVALAWPGCCTGRRTSCSFPAPHRRRTCARTSPARDSRSPTRKSPS